MSGFRYSTALSIRERCSCGATFNLDVPATHSNKDPDYSSAEPQFFLVMDRVSAWRKEHVHSMPVEAGEPVKQPDETGVGPVTALADIAEAHGVLP